MFNANDSLIGRKFTRLLVKKRSDNDRHGSTRWVCRCDCGKEFIAKRSALLNGRNKSCGCLNREVQKNNHFNRHGIYALNPKFYMHYNTMKNRCLNPDYTYYSSYGARGILICDRWLGENGPKNFYDDMFCTWALGLTLDRIDNNKGYYKENCKWSTAKEQCQNKRNTLKFLYKGIEYTILQLCKISGLSYACLFCRIKYLGWTIEDSIETPSQKKT